MHDHDAPSPSDPNSPDDATTAAEATAPEPTERPESDTPPPADAPLAEADDEDDDDGPVELEDPFSGSEDAQPVMMDGDEEEGEDNQPSMADMDWYILKVQSNREDSIRDTLMRRIAMQGMDKWFGEVVVPKEQVTEFKSGKKRVVWRKL